MEPSPELAAALWREEIDDARRLTVSQRLELSGNLFDSACQVTLSGIRAQHPGISDEQAMHLLRERLELGRRLEVRP